MRHLTVRNVPEDLAGALLRHRRESGRSLNQTVIDPLRRAVGLTPAMGYDNGLSELAGGWNDDDLAEFERNTRAFEEIDRERKGEEERARVDRRVPKRREPRGTAPGTAPHDPPRVGLRAPP